MINVQIIHWFYVLSLSSGNLPGCRERKRHPVVHSKQVMFATLSFLYIQHGYFEVKQAKHVEQNLTLSNGTPDVPDEMEGSSTPKRSRFNLHSRDVEVEEEDRSVRRSSRITRYTLNSRNQSVLYDRLITKWVHRHSIYYLLSPNAWVSFGHLPTSIFTFLKLHLL